MKRLWVIFLTFCKVGGLTFGGGYAIMPLLQKEVVQNKGWAKEEEVMEYYAISQCLPGPIAINVSIMLGHKLKGASGAVAAALGVIMPSIIVIIVLAVFLQGLMDIPLIGHAFAGIRVAVSALVIHTVVVLGRRGVKDFYGLLIFIVVFIFALFTDISPAYIIVAAGLFGILIKKRGEGAK